METSLRLALHTWLSLYPFQKIPKAVVTAKTMKRDPPMIPITRSDRYLATTAPPETAIPVATAWAAMAPAATLAGFWAAERAIVDRKLLSPNSAANTSPKMLKMRALGGRREGDVVLSCAQREKP
jgi:hypothetical protein